MKVKTFLNKFLLSSTVDIVRIQKNGYTKTEYDSADLRLMDYGPYGNETVTTFSVIGNVLIINI